MGHWFCILSIWVHIWAMSVHDALYYCNFKAGVKVMRTLWSRNMAAQFLCTNLWNCMVHGLGLDLPGAAISRIHHIFKIL